MKNEEKIETWGLSWKNVAWEGIFFHENVFRATFFKNLISLFIYFSFFTYASWSGCLSWHCIDLRMIKPFSAQKKVVGWTMMIIIRMTNLTKPFNWIVPVVGRFFPHIFCPVEQFTFTSFSTPCSISFRHSQFHPQSSWCVRYSVAWPCFNPFTLKHICYVCFFFRNTTLWYI